MTKTAFESKTVVFNLLLAIAISAAAFLPDAQEFVKGNTAPIGYALVVINVILRRVTNSRWQLFPSPTDDK